MAEYGKPIPSGPSTDPTRRYKTVDDAAAALLWIIQNQKNANSAEYLGGVLKQPEGDYTLTRLGFSDDPHTVYPQDAQGIIGLPNLVAFAHNHPGMRTDINQRAIDMLSTTDRATGMGEHTTTVDHPVSMYLAGMRHDGKIPDERVLPPDNRTKTTLHPNIKDMTAAVQGYEGDKFLAEIPWDDIKDWINRRYTVTKNWGK